MQCRSGAAVAAAAYGWYADQSFTVSLLCCYCAGFLCTGATLQQSPDAVEDPRPFIKCTTSKKPDDDVSGRKNITLDIGYYSIKFDVYASKLRSQCSPGYVAMPLCVRD